MGKGPGPNLVLWELDRLLSTQPGLSLRPSINGSVVLAGDFTFTARARGREEISDQYQLEISVPDGFPRFLPAAKETAGRIPDDFHTHDDDTLCLGSEIRLHMALSRRPTLIGFIETCLVPYLYGFSYKERHGELPFGDLRHGREGLLDDYMAMFSVDRVDACLQLLMLAAKRKRLANRELCPCASGLRVGRCHHLVLNRLRKIRPRSWFRREHDRLSRSR